MTGSLFTHAIGAEIPGCDRYRVWRRWDRQCLGHMRTGGVDHATGALSMMAEGGRSHGD